MTPGKEGVTLPLGQDVLRQAAAQVVIAVRDDRLFGDQGTAQRPHELAQLGLDGPGDRPSRAALAPERTMLGDAVPRLVGEIAREIELRGDGKRYRDITPIYVRLAEAEVKLQQK